MTRNGLKWLETTTLAQSHIETFYAPYLKWRINGANFIRHLYFGA